MFDKPFEVGRCYELEMVVIETKVISRQPPPVQIMID